MEVSLKVGRLPYAVGKQPSIPLINDDDDGIVEKNGRQDDDIMIMMQQTDKLDRFFHYSQKFVHFYKVVIVSM